MNPGTLEPWNLFALAFLLGQTADQTLAAGVERGGQLLTAVDEVRTAPPEPSQEVQQFQITHDVGLAVGRQRDPQVVVLTLEHVGPTLRPIEPLWIRLLSQRVERGGMPPPHLARFVHGHQSLDGELTNAFEHSISRFGRPAAIYKHQRLVDQTCQPVDELELIDAVGDLRNETERPAASEDRYLTKKLLLFVGKLVVAPLDCREQRLVSWQG